MSSRIVKRCKPLPDAEARDKLHAMNHDTPVPTPFQPPRPGPRGHAWPAWIVILLGVGIVVAANNMVEEEEAAVGEDPVMTRVFELQSKVYLGQLEAEEVSDRDRNTLYRQANRLLNQNTTIRQQQRFTVLAFELRGLDEAHRLLDLIDERLAEQPGEIEELPAERRDDARAWHEKHVQTQAALRTLYDDQGPSVDALSAEQRRLLADRLGWIGEVALLPPGDEHAGARSDLLEPYAEILNVAVVAIIALVGLAVIGFIGLGLCVALAFMGRLGRGLSTTPVHHGIYAETFAVWLIVFYGLQSAAGLVAPAGLGMFVAFVAFMLSLVALAWPVVRGIPFNRVRVDIGWHLGRWHVGEIVMAAPCYVMSLPIMSVGLLAVLLLLLIVEMLSGGSGVDPQSAPTHPIMQQIGSDWWSIVQLFLVASVAAPVVEETMMRGVLYRHLRDVSRGWATFASITLGTLLNAFIFAVIHPQGFIAVPALMSIAIGFTLAREWRDSLVPSIVMHGVHNGMLMTVLVVVFGD